MATEAEISNREWLEFVKWVAPMPDNDNGDIFSSDKPPKGKVLMPHMRYTTVKYPRHAPDDQRDQYWAWTHAIATEWRKANMTHELHPDYIPVWGRYVHKGDT